MTKKLLLFSLIFTLNLNSISFCMIKTVEKPEYTEEKIDNKTNNESNDQYLDSWTDKSLHENKIDVETKFGRSNIDAHKIICISGTCITAITILICSASVFFIKLINSAN